MATSDDYKRQAALRAIKEVRPGMRLGLGTGSTAAHFIAALGHKVAAGLDVVCVPTSLASETQARELSIPLTTLDQHPRLDLAVDGADEIGPGLSLIKGAGGALLREKIVESAAARFIVIADASKKVPVLGGFPVPVEVATFGLTATGQAIERALAALGLLPRIALRKRPDGATFFTDGGNAILDLSLGAISDPAVLASALDSVPGVVEHGLFLGLADTAFIAGPDGINEVHAS